MRTIIELRDDQVDALADLCRRDGISRAEAIRRAVDRYLEATGPPADDEAFGLWSDRDLDGLQYERRLRDEWSP